MVNADAGKYIVMPARTVADWGGLHEWVLLAAIALQRAGHRVAVAGSGETFQARISGAGISFIEVDWDDPSENLNRVLEAAPPSGIDIAFGHGPGARELTLAIGSVTDAQVDVMVHGAYHDYVYTWDDSVDGIQAASPALVDFLVRIGKVAPWKVSLVPNGVPDDVFDMNLSSLDERLSSGTGHIVMASRLASDKVKQIPAAIEAISAAATVRPEITWQLDVLGDGPLRELYERELNSGLRSVPNARVAFHGWVAPEQVPVHMNQSVMALVSGMGGVRALASGTLCIGVGFRTAVGVQFGQNLRAGLWSNFGDHGCPNFEPSPIFADVKSLVGSSNGWAEAVAIGRSVAQRSRSQSIVDSSIMSALLLE